jgi:FMN-dependent NADH-azoreductase
MTHTVLRLDASARRDGSASRQLADRVIERLAPERVIHRDLAEPLPLIDETWIGANFTPEPERTDAQRDALALSDTLIAELNAADTVVLGLPIYNFGVPAAFKAWIDLVARAGVTFRYSEAGPEGLLTGKRVVLVAASGGTAVGSDLDFATGYVRHILGFLGLREIEVIGADRLAIDPEDSLKTAEAEIDRLAA